MASLRNLLAVWALTTLLASGRAEAQASYQSQAPTRSERAWQRFLGQVGGEWKALWEPTTGMPVRIYGSGIAFPGSTASADKAQRAALTILAAHIDLFAPGVSMDDFKVVSNLLTTRGMRVVGLQQFHAGMPIVGAQFSLRIVQDRVIVIAGEARRALSIRSALHPLSAREAGERAQQTIAGPTQIGLIDDLSVWPSGEHQGTVARRVRIDEIGSGKSYQLFVDTDSGAILESRPLHEEGSATIEAKAPIRSWHLGYATFPLPSTQVSIAGQSQLSTSSGQINFSGSSAQAELRLVGPHARVINEGGADYLQPVNLQDGQSLLWNASGDEFRDAQLSAFVHVQVAKDFARTIEPGLAWLDEQMSLSVNEDATCNAYSNHNELHFYRAGGSCGNTARIPDVVYHEFGHSVYHAIRIEGVGLWTRSFTEGLADFYAVSMTGDPAWGEGFVNQSGPTRHCDPVGVEKRWPEDTGNYYEDGIIYCGAMFDLRKRLIDLLGPEAGAIKSNQLFFDSSRSLRDIPTTFVELLAADDDDGNLANGTPNGCLIQEAFARHGLADPDYQFTVSALAPELGTELRLSAALPTLCSIGEAPAQVVAHYRITAPGQTEPGPVEEIELASQGAIASALLARPEWGSLVEYQFEVEPATGASYLLPDTAASPWYQYFVGEATELYCSNFEGDEPLFDWQHQATLGSDSWNVGRPSGASLDPRSAFSGELAVGTAVGPSESLGAYGNELDSQLVSPSIDVSGFEHVRLQYRRWLSVEDALYDQARLLINDEVAWSNATGNGDLHHFDREWRFHDMDVSALAQASEHIQVGFELATDRAKTFGGWTVDDFCIVGYDLPVCGDGVVGGFEACDDGNADEDDDCLSNCQISETIEPDPEDPDELMQEAGCGCSSGSSAPSTWLALWIAGMLLWVRRRQRRLSLAFFDPLE